MLSPEPTEPEFNCNHCEVSSKTEHGLKIHIGKAHKHAFLEDPKKERSTIGLEEPILTLTPPKLCSREEELIDEAEKPFDLEVQESKTKVEPCPFCPADWYSKENGYCQCGKCEDCETMTTQDGIDIHILNEHEPTQVLRHFGEYWIMKRKHYIYGTHDPNWNKTWKSLNML